MSIPDIAVQIIEKTVTQLNEDNARAIIIVGSKSVGKSKLLYSFLEKTDTPRETLVLEYSFGRKSSQKQGLEKTICHVWEYGGKLEMLKNVAVSIPLRGKFFYCIMVDISKIKSLWNTLELCIQAMKEICKEPASNSTLIIIGGKYDVFKNYDNETKKCVCTMMRSIAIMFKGHLIFYSYNEPQLAKKAKEMLYNIGFGNCVPIKEKNTNYTKPLLIPEGLDSWENIGVPVSTLDQVKMRYLSRIPPERDNIEDIKSLQFSHPEPILDALVAAKYKELRNMQSFDPAIDEYISNLVQ